MVWYSPRDEKVVVISTGGTIAFSREGERHLTCSELLASVGSTNLPAGLRLETVDLMASGSMDVGPSEVMRIARYALAASEGGSRVVVLHGTDTLEESAYLTEMLIGGSCFVVFTGSMIRPDDPLGDARRNLCDAILVAASAPPDQTGVVVVADSQIHTAANVCKVWSAARLGFTSGDSGPVGSILGPRVGLQHWDSDASRLVSFPSYLIDVPLVFVYSGMEASHMERLVPPGLRGLVVAGFGQGDVPTGLLAVLRGVIESGVTVVVASKCRFAGSVDADSEPSSVVGRQDMSALLPGVIRSSLNPWKARLRLMVLLSGGVGGASLESEMR